MTNTAAAMTRYVDAAQLLMEGMAPTSDTVFAGHDIRAISTIVGTIETMHGRGSDVVTLLFEPDAQEGPTRIGVAVADGAMIKLQFGTLWLAPDGDKAVLIPRGCGKRFGHYAIEGGRIVQRPGWPARDLARGTARAARRLRALADIGANASPTVRVAF